MDSPDYKKIPNEATIEQVGNHHLLLRLGSDRAWIYVPTRQDEAYAGYDASLRNHKVLLIQYKAVRSISKSGYLGVEIDENYCCLAQKRLELASKPGLTVARVTLPNG